MEDLDVNEYFEEGYPLTREEAEAALEAAKKWPSGLSPRFWLNARKEGLPCDPEDTGYIREHLDECKPFGGPAVAVASVRRAKGYRSPGILSESMEDVGDAIREWEFNSFYYIILSKNPREISERLRQYLYNLPDTETGEKDEVNRPDKR